MEIGFVWGYLGPEEFDFFVEEGALAVSARDTLLWLHLDAWGGFGAFAADEWRKVWPAVLLDNLLLFWLNLLHRLIASQWFSLQQHHKIVDFIAHPRKLRFHWVHAHLNLL